MMNTRTGLPLTEVVSGCASGAYKSGESWARFQGIPVRKMVEYADAVVLFPGGRGTASMKREAERAGIKVYDWTNAPIERLE